MVSRFAPIIALLLASCGGAVAQMSEDERESFNRCWHSMEVPICGQSSDSVYLSTCRRRSGNEWAELDPGDQRNEWLLAHGCPASMVYPAETREAVQRKR